MDFSDLRVGHRLKCVKEYELLPFKVDTEYEIINVNDGRVIVCEVGNKSEEYPLDISICMDYFEFSPTSSPVIKGFGVYKQQDKDETSSTKETENPKTKDILSEISNLVEKDSEIINSLLDSFGLNYPLIELTKEFESFKSACYSDMSDNQYYENVKKHLIDIEKVSIQTVSWIDKEDEDGEEESVEKQD